MPNNPNNLPFLRDDLDTARVAVQRTKFFRDSLGRFICNTWDEATAAVTVADMRDATAMFDAIVIGSGMYGAYCGHQIWRRGGKVLVLEAGSLLLPEHGQNLARGLGFDAPDKVEHSINGLKTFKIIGAAGKGNSGK